MTVDIDAFFPLVQPRVLTCPPPTMEQAIREAGTKLCRHTRCVREVYHMAIDGGGEQHVDLPVSPDMQVFRIEGAWVDGARLEPRQFHEIAGHADAPGAFFQRGPHEVIINVPDSCRVKISAFLEPEPNADTLPRVLYDDFRDAVADGALVRLMTMQGTAWFNPQLAAYHDVRFREACDQHFAANVHGRHRAPARTRASYF